MTSDWTNKRVTVVGGLGIEGQDLTRYFARHGARVTVSDMRTADRAPAAVAALRTAGRRRCTSARTCPTDGINADLVAVTQGAPLTNPIVVAARQHGVEVASMASLFFDRYPGPVCGITGSSGKTTTTSLVDRIFTSANVDHVLGGNIGRGLMALLDDAIAERWAVVEVSHTQLQLTKRSPHVAALLRITPNHLDAFTWDEYVALKRRIYELQTQDDIAVFNADDPVSRDLVSQAAGETLLFSRRDRPRQGRRLLRRRHDLLAPPRPHRALRRGVRDPAAWLPQRRQRYRRRCHRRGLRIGPDAVAAAVRSFKAPEHRLEFVAKVDGASYYNDSIATAPERTVAALRSFDEPVVLLLGGREKKLPLEEMVDEIVEALPRRRLLRRSRPADGRSRAHHRRAGRPRHDRSRTPSTPPTPAPRTATSSCSRPACTSFDAYDNFEQRGIEFRRLVKELAPARTRP